MPGMVTIDASRIPTGWQGWSDARISNTSEQAPRDNGDYPIGAFRTSCNFSHMAFDDPIVKPNQPGASHLHAFFGNTGVNAATTSTSLATTGNSTCNGGIANRSGYWVPAMVDTRTGTPIRPSSLQVYYKTGYGGVRAEDVQPLPEGLRIIAGDAMNRNAAAPHVSWDCTDGTRGNTGFRCNAEPGGEMRVVIEFPQCWDGRNLDSPDHKSHMAYPNNGCPSTHPVPLPAITFNVIYKPPMPDPRNPQAAVNVQAAREWSAGVPSWRLASDAANGVSGASSHADWWNGWRRDIMLTWVTNCDNKYLDCHSHLLGDGRMLEVIPEQ